MPDQQSLGILLQHFFMREITKVLTLESRNPEIIIIYSLLSNLNLKAISRPLIIFQGRPGLPTHFSEIVCITFFDFIHFLSARVFPKFENYSKGS